MEGRITDAALLANVGRLRAGILLLHDRDDLLVRKPALLHVSASSRGGIDLGVVLLQESTPTLSNGRRRIVISRAFAPAECQPLMHDEVRDRPAVVW